MDIIEIDHRDPRNTKCHVPRSQQTHYQRNGLLAAADEWYTPESGTFSLAPTIHADALKAEEHRRWGTKGTRRKRLDRLEPTIRNGC